MPIVIQEKFKNTNKKKQSKGGGGMDIGSPKKTTTKKLGGSMYMKKTKPAVKRYKKGGKVPMPKPAPKTNVFTGSRKKDVNQAKAESMGKKGRRAGTIEKGLIGAGLALATRGRAGTGAALTGAKEIGKRAYKAAKDAGVVAVGGSRTQPKKGGEYRMVKPRPPKKRQTISGISKRSTQTGKGIRKTPKPIVSALGVAGAKKKDNVVKPKNVATPKPRPSSIKPKKKGMFMKEGSGVSGKDMRGAKDSNVKFKSKVIKRKK